MEKLTDSIGKSHPLTHTHTHKYNILKALKMKKSTLMVFWCDVNYIYIIYYINYSEKKKKKQTTTNKKHINWGGGGIEGKTWLKLKPIQSVKADDFQAFFTSQWWKKNQRWRIKDTKIKITKI